MTFRPYCFDIGQRTYRLYAALRGCRPFISPQGYKAMCVTIKKMLRPRNKRLGVS